MLDRDGYAVVVATDSLEALRLLETDGRFDALVTDVVMPDLSGAELARRAMSLRPGLPIVLLSGYSAETKEIEALVRKGARFASKPIAGRDLLALLEAAIEEHARAF